MNETVFIKNRTKGSHPDLPFSLMKDFVLGEEYELSVVFVGNAASRALNKKWRQKDKPTNVLAFPLSPDMGEIFINIRKANQEAAEFERKPENFIAFLFIHALVHLKGLDHGDEMEAEEVRVRKKFGI